LIRLYSFSKSQNLDEFFQTSMSLRVGQTIRGKRATYQVFEPLKSPTVFKARVLPGGDIKEKWYVFTDTFELALTLLRAVVKTAMNDLERVALRREYRNYQIPALASSRFIRTMYEVVGPIEANECSTQPGCLVFEYMDTVLRKVPSNLFRDSNLPKGISKSVLSALEVMRAQHKVHTGKSPCHQSDIVLLIECQDVNYNNVFISNLDHDSPVVKLGDLGTRTPPAMF
jgi:hypothetical protein